MSNQIMNPAQSLPVEQASNPKTAPLSATECMIHLIRSGKDAKMLLEPIREFCKFAQDEHGIFKPDEFNLFNAVDEVDQLLDKWDDPSFPDIATLAMTILKKILREVDSLIFKIDVGKWEVVWHGLYNAVALQQKRAQACTEMSAHGVPKAVQ